MIEHPITVPKRRIYVCVLETLRKIKFSLQHLVKLKKEKIAL